MPSSHALRPLLQVSCVAEKPSQFCCAAGRKKRPCAQPTARQTASSALVSPSNPKSAEISKKSGANPCSARKLE